MSYTTEEQDLIATALSIVRLKLHNGPVFEDPDTVKQWLTLHFAAKEREEFVCLWLTTRHQLITAETVALGTLRQASVYPRELAKSALRFNASAVILAHNHPSGNAEPSRADEYLTGTVKTTLNLIDVRVLDHLVVGGDGVRSMAQLGLM